MGFLSGLFRFVLSIFMGAQERNKSFIRSLDMGERYLRWAVERKDLRDYMAAMEHLRRCRDEDAPKAEFLLKKYRAMCTACEGAAEYLVTRFKNETSTLEQERSGMELEYRQIQKALEQGASNVEELKQSGSVIRAKEEEKRLDEMRLRATYLEKMLADSERSRQSQEKYAEAVAEGERLFREVEDSLESLDQSEDIPAESLAQVREETTSRLQRARDSIQALAPA